MNQGQQQFFDFIAERLSPEHYDEGVALLNEGFAKQADGSFSQQYLKEYHEKMLSFLKPESVEEVKRIMEQFGGSHVS